MADYKEISRQIEQIKKEEGCLEILAKGTATEFIVEFIKYKSERDNYEGCEP